MIANVAELQAQVSDLQHVDFRWTWGGLVAGFLILLGFLASGYLRLSDQLDQKTTSLLTATVRTETKLDDLSQRLLPPPAPPRR
jgi:hypothetical protein